MVYAYDRNIQMPTKDLYDTQMMAMAVSAAKDEYEKAEKRLDDLNKLYGDFYSPSDVDMQNWQTYVVSPIKDKLDELYAKGIDPTRSAEGRAILAKASRDLPYQLMNQLKQSAAVGQEYVKNANKLLAENLYDPEYEKFLDRDLKNWDTRSRGVWGYSSPSAAPTLQDFIEPYYNKRQARPLTQEEVVAEGVQYDPLYNYTGYLDKDLLEDAEANLPAILNTPFGQYQRELARKQVAKLLEKDPEDVDDAEADRQLVRNVAGAAYKWKLAPDRELDELRGYEQKAKITRRYSNSGGSGGGNGGGYYAEAPYSIKTRMFNEGLANLLGINVDVIDDVAKNGKFVYDRAVETQTALASEYRTANSLVSALSQQTPYSRQQIIDVLDLKQVGDDDKQNNIYTMDKHELKNIVDASYIASRIKTSDPLDTGTVDQGTKVIRNKYKNTYRSDMKVDPTGNIVTYLDKNGTIKKYAELEIVGGGSGAGETVYIDLGNNSTKVDGSDAPVGMDYTQSTLRDYNYEAIDNKRASNQTKTIVTSYNR